jgi:hypothetical protein
MTLVLGSLGLLVVCLLDIRQPWGLMCLLYVIIEMDWGVTCLLSSQLLANSAYFVLMPFFPILASSIDMSDLEVGLVFRWHFSSAYPLAAFVASPVLTAPMRSIGFKSPLY